MTLLTFERITVPAGLPVTGAEIGEALRVADELLTEASGLHVPAAVAELQDFGGLALLEQTIRAVYLGPFGEGRTLRLPVAPVQAGADCTVKMREFDGTETALDAGLWRLIGGKRPELRLMEATLPAALAEARTSLVIDYEAGFGANEASVPRDLKLAVLDHALRLYDLRGEDYTRGAARLSVHAARIVTRWRGVAL